MHDALVQVLDRDFPRQLARLCDLAAIPSCSFADANPVHLVQSAEATALWLKDSGFHSIQTIRMSGGHPTLIARTGKPGGIKVLCYAHHDVQPSLDLTQWTSAPFTPTQRNGRLYGRGVSDDKAGIFAVCAAATAWNQVQGTVPVEVIALFDGAEEVGSPGLEELVLAHRDFLRCDVSVILDSTNLAVGVPCLTTSLRGIAVWDISMHGIGGAVHSGLWGGPVPEATLALTRLVGSLADGFGRPLLKGLPKPTIPQAFLDGLQRIPFDAAATRQFLAPVSADFAVDPVGFMKALWFEPSFSINAIHAGGTKGDAGNVINPSAWCRLGLRLAPGMDPAASEQAVEQHLHAHMESGLSLKLESEHAAAPWIADPSEKSFQIALQALSQGYRATAHCIGSGGTIPVVELLQRTLGAHSALLFPVEDPSSRIHGIDESIDLGDLAATTRSLAFLFGMLKA